MLALAGVAALLVLLAVQLADRPLRLEFLRASIEEGLRAQLPPGARLSIGDLEMELETRKVTRNTQPVELTEREFELLEYLLR